MSFDVETLFRLLPAIHRVRDVELARGNAHLLTPEDTTELATLESTPGLPVEKQERLDDLRERRDRGALKSLLAVLAEPIAAVEENLDQLYDDQFIETCAEWVIPYIGDLIGYRALHAVAPNISSSRAEVAHTMAYRRRKGTAAVLEQLARDVTGWNARAVEFFQLLATTQHMNHLRPGNVYAPNLRDWEPLERLGTAFDTVPHTVDVRRIASNSGRYNIPNVGLFLWRLNAYSLTKSPAIPVQLDATHTDNRRYRLSPLGQDTPLFSRPETEDEITHLAQPVNVPMPLSRPVLYEDLRRLDKDKEYIGFYYGANRSLNLFVDDTEIPVRDVTICDLSDSGSTWANLPPDGKYAVDPVLGRVVLPPNLNFHTSVAARFHYGFSAELGGGEYPRAGTLTAPLDDTRVIRVPSEEPSLQRAVAALDGAGIIEIGDSGRYEEALSIEVATERTIEIRAIDGGRPTLILTEELRLAGGKDAEVVINGLLIAGYPLRVPAQTTNELRHLRILHSTLVPGRTLTSAGDPVEPGAPSIVVEIDDVEVTIERSITGGVRAPSGATLSLADCIVDAGSPAGVAFSAPETTGANGNSTVVAGGKLNLEGCTVIGKVYAYQLSEVSNSILLADRIATDSPAWTAPVIAERRQEGCVRFSYLPFELPSAASLSLQA